MIWNRYSAVLDNYLEYSLDDNCTVKPGKQMWTYNILYWILLHILHTYCFKQYWERHGFPVGPFFESY